MSGRPSSPCLDCPDRSVECHSQCEKYRQYKADNDKYNESVQEQKRMKSWEYACDRMFDELTRQYRKGQGKWSRKRKW